MRYATSPVRRLLFAGVAAILAISAAVGLSSAGAPDSESLTGTLFFAALLLISIGSAGFREAVEFASRPPRALFRTTLFGIPLRTQLVEEDAELGIVVRELRMLDTKSAAPRNRVMQSMLERRAVLYRLYVESSTGLRLISESSELSDLKDAGAAIADFLEIPYRYERL